MSAPGTGNRAMFWRIVRRLLGANRGRLLVILLALGAGAAVTAALLNLQVDAKSRITTEFRVFGANVIISARTNSGSQNSPSTPMVDDEIAASNDGAEITHVALLYLNIVASREADTSNPVRVVLVGTEGKNVQRVLPSRIVEAAPFPAPRADQAQPPTSSLSRSAAGLRNCRVGEKSAAVLRLHAGDRIELTNRSNRLPCFVSTVEEFGGPEDSQILTDLFTVQQLTWVAGETTSNNVSLILLNVPGSPQSVEHCVSRLQLQFPNLDVHPIRQFTEGEAKIYDRISGLLTATVVIVLLLTGLCVMAAMTNVAMERKNDVGLMKAIGGATRRVLRLFMMEAALLGFAGGMVGAAVGIFLSIWLGKQVFGVAAQPRLIVYPVSVALTTIVAILSAYPLRRLASVRPASVFRGEA